MKSYKQLPAPVSIAIDASACLLFIYIYACSRPEKFSSRSFAWTITTKRRRFSSYWMGTRKGTLGCFQRSRRLTKSSAPKGESKPAAGGGGHRFAMPNVHHQSKAAAMARSTRTQHNCTLASSWMVSQLWSSEQRVMSWWWREKTRWPAGVMHLQGPAASCTSCALVFFSFGVQYSLWYGFLYFVCT